MGLHNAVLRSIAIAWFFCLSIGSQENSLSARASQKAVALERVLPPVPQQRGRDRYTGQIVPMPSQPYGKTIPLHRTADEQRIVDIHIIVEGLVRAVDGYNATDDGAVRSVLSSAIGVGNMFARFRQRSAMIVGPTCAQIWSTCLRTRPLDSVLVSTFIVPGQPTKWPLFENMRRVNDCRPKWSGPT